MDCSPRLPADVNPRTSPHTRNESDGVSSTGAAGVLSAEVRAQCDDLLSGLEQIEATEAVCYESLLKTLDALREDLRVKDMQLLRQRETIASQARELSEIKQNIANQCRGGA